MLRTRDRRIGADPSADRTPGSRVVGRQSRARLNDGRVWGALALVIVSAVLGAALLGRGDDTVLVLRAQRDLSVGSAPRDLASVAVPRAIADGYVSATDDLRGELRAPIAAGELVPRSALMPASSSSLRTVTVPVDPLHAPAGLQSGDLVDVWATVSAAGGVTAPGAPPRLVLRNVLVTSVATDGVGFGGGWGVALAVPEVDVAEVIATARGSVLDLVTVPITDQQAVVAADDESVDEEGAP